MGMGRSPGTRFIASTISLLALLITLSVMAMTPSEAAPAPAAGAVPQGLVTSSRDTVSVISWQPVPEAVGYVVTMAANSSMLYPETRHVATSMAILTGLKPATTYYLHVAAIDSTGTFGPTSPAVSFTTAERSFRYPTPTPELTSPTSTTVVATWTAPQARLRYQAEIASQPTMDAARTISVDKPAAEFDSLKPEAPYYVRVRVVDGSGAPASGWSAPEAITTSSQGPLRVASFNVKCETCGGTSWATRRGAVVSSIRAQNPDVIGIQEASQGWLAGSRISQFEDLANRLGNPYRLANDRRNNCVKHWTPSGCRYRDQGASQGTRIIYNSQRLELLAQGSRRLLEASSGANDRYVAWAIFRQRSTGKSFFFADTHLEPIASFSARNKQTRQVLATIDANNPRNLPSIVVGDFNSHKWTKPSNGPYNIMKAAGYVDPLGNTYRSTTRAPVGIVERRINTSYSSYNDYRRQPPRFGYTNGTYLDYIFTTRMRVSEWETVVKVDSRGRFIGVIPSDHNLIRATVWLP